MAKVSLRIYNREVENLVDSGQLDEAIAHCRHILNAFPKDLETYRLIGKAYLEAKRYDEATDIFERLLMAVPNDFVAHVGMSIIHDEQNDMDAAIWHMERAFEVQSSNAAIQAELQRLYGRRDGMEPPKIRLTRGALAHMYVHGELYPQAISEIKGVLEEDPERQDMQVLLARAYFHAGQKGEAAEVCSQLLRRYPYCFDANRVLVELLPETERGESTQIYRHRVNELDPYATFTTGSVFHTDEVPDAAISLERLEWDGQPVDMEPAWSDSLGIGRGDTAARDEEPEWLKTGLASDSFGSSMPTASSPQEEPASAPGSLPIPTAGGDDSIPDFMREAGWGEDTGTFQESPGTFDTSDQTSKESELAEGDLPDWVKALAPAGADVEDVTPPAEIGEDLTQDDVPDWLQGLGDAQEMPAEEQQPLAEGELPDWLESMKPADETLQELQPEEPVMAEPTSEADLPDWLESMQPEEGKITPQEPVDETPEEILPEPAQEIPEMSGESLSDWQISEEEAAGPVEFDATDTGALGTSATEQDDAIAWLEGLAAKHGAKPEELVTDPNARSEEEPEWVQQAKAVKEQGPFEAPLPEGEPLVEPSADLPDFLVEEKAAPAEEAAADLPPFLAEKQAAPVEEPAAKAEPGDISTLGASAEEQEDAVAWLESLAAKHGAKPEELVTDPEARKETAPEWVQKAAQASAEKPPVEEAVPLEEPVESEPEWTEQAEQVGESLYAEVEEAQTPIPTAGADETGVWLHELEEGGGSAEEQVEAPAIEGDIPDWLRGLDSAGEAPGAFPETEVVPEAEGALEAETVPGFVDEAEPGIVPEAEAVPGFVDEAEPGIVPEAEATPWFTEEAEAVPGTAEEAEPEPPDWLRSLEAESSGVEAEGASTEESAVDSLPAWLAGLDSEMDQPKPVVSSAGDLPDWLQTADEQEPVQAEPTMPTDWRPVEVPSPTLEEPAEPAPEPEVKLEEQPVESAPATVPEPKPEPKPEPPAVPEREPYREPVTRSRSGMTGILSAAEDPALNQAQLDLTRGNIPAAMESYGKLIKKGKMLDEIIFDLREALYRYPVEVSILQALGDAYMRANRLQDALDAYTKAEELLR